MVRTRPPRSRKRSRRSDETARHQLEARGKASSHLTLTALLKLGFLVIVLTDAGVGLWATLAGGTSRLSSLLDSVAESVVSDSRSAPISAWSVAGRWSTDDFSDCSSSALVKLAAS